MISWISEWIKNIVFIILLASFVDLLLPSSSMQKYARIVLGMLIVLIIITPILEIFGDAFSVNNISEALEKNILSQTNISAIADIDTINQKGQGDYQARVLNQVEADMKKKLGDILKDKNFAINNLILEAIITNASLEIKKITIYVSKISTQALSNNALIETVEIKNIVINKDTAYATDRKEENLKNIEDIKELVKKELGIENERVVVYLESDMR